ncbi:MAG TPA: hypothetical protein VHO47_00825 [Candidatus Babeliales bacterium]|nr:hypothetical protein [Candidatus Babeliales bacterium]
MQKIILSQLIFVLFSSVCFGEKINFQKMIESIKKGQQMKNSHEDKSHVIGAIGIILKNSNPEVLKSGVLTKQKIEIAVSESVEFGELSSILDNSHMSYETAPKLFGPKKKNVVDVPRIEVKNGTLEQLMDYVTASEKVYDSLSYNEPEDSYHLDLSAPNAFARKIVEDKQAELPIKLFVLPKDESHCYYLTNVDLNNLINAGREAHNSYDSQNQTVCAVALDTNVKNFVEKRMTINVWKERLKGAAFVGFFGGITGLVARRLGWFK